MSAPTDWPEGLRVAVIAGTMVEARDVIDAHPEFFATRSGIPISHRSVSRGITADALWVVSEYAYGIAFPLLAPALQFSKEWADHRRVHR